MPKASRKNIIPRRTRSAAVAKAANQLNPNLRALTLFEALPPGHVTFRVRDDGAEPMVAGQAIGSSHCGYQANSWRWRSWTSPMFQTRATKLKRAGEGGAILLRGRPDRGKPHRYAFGCADKSGGNSCY